jgi:hypothetical protein
MDILKVREVAVDELRGLQLFGGGCEGVTPENVVSTTEIMQAGEAGEL